MRPHVSINIENVEKSVEFYHRIFGVAPQKRTIEDATNCCYAMQDKVWFQDPSGNAWDVFVVHHQLPITNPDGNIYTPFNKTKNPGKKCC